MRDARAARRGQRLDHDGKSLVVLGFRGGFERCMAAGYAILGRGLAIGLTEGARESIGAAVAGAFRNRPLGTGPSSRGGRRPSAAEAGESWRRSSHRAWRRKCDANDRARGRRPRQALRDEYRHRDARRCGRRPDRAEPDTMLVSAASPSSRDLYPLVRDGLLTSQSDKSCDFYHRGPRRGAGCLVLQAKLTTVGNWV